MARSEVVLVCACAPNPPVSSSTLLQRKHKRVVTDCSWPSLGTGDLDMEAFVWGGEYIEKVLGDRCLEANETHKDRLRRSDPINQCHQAHHILSRGKHVAVI